MQRSSRPEGRKARQWVLCKSNCASVSLGCFAGPMPANARLGYAQPPLKSTRAETFVRPVAAQTRRRLHLPRGRALSFCNDIREKAMDFTIPQNIKDLLTKIDAFIDKEIVPLQKQDDNERFFDHRREWARTDFEHGGLPRKEWENLLREMRKRADKAGFLRLALPEEFGGKNIGNLAMAIIREHLATKGLGLHNDLQNETSVVGNFPQLLMFRDFGTEEQKKTILPGMLDGKIRIAFGLTEPKHGSDATWMETRAVKDGNGWRINGEKMWNTGVHVATHDMVFCRTSGNDGDARGLTCLIVPMNDPGVKIEEYMWTFNMPTDHARVSFKNVWVPDGAVFGPVDNGL